jgi:hypothetical protein
VRHVTLGPCPWCGAADRIVADLDRHVFHCFACGRDGAVSVTLHPDATAAGQAAEPRSL